MVKKALKYTFCFPYLIVLSTQAMEKSLVINPSNLPLLPTERKDSTSPQSFIKAASDLVLQPAQSHDITLGKAVSASQSSPRESASAQKTETVQAEHKIVLKANITAENMSHPVPLGSSRVSPKEFVMKINGTPLPLSEKFTTTQPLELPVPITDNTLRIEYTYDWKRLGYRGTDEHLFNIPSGLAQATVSFAWETKPVHVSINNDPKLLQEKISSKDGHLTEKLFYANGELVKKQLYDKHGEPTKIEYYKNGKIEPAKIKK